MKSPDTLHFGSIDAKASKASRLLTGAKPIAIKVFAASAMALTLAGCKSLEDPGEVQSWSLVDAKQRHPIMVSKAPSKVKISVAQGSDGLAIHQRAKVSNFLANYRASGMSNSRLIISAPSGAPNEVAAMHAVADIRHMMEKSGFSDDIVSVEAYHDEDDPQPSVRLSYLRYVAKGPECGDWSVNLADNPRNLPYPNFGCANQRNFAAMIDNPRDLLEPRTSSGRDSDRRSVAYGKFIKGRSTISGKKNDERARSTKK